MKINWIIKEKDTFLLSPKLYETYICFQHTKGHENVIANPKGVAIPPKLLHFVRNDK
ncbi:hypothetical protein M1M98_01265 [Thermodesulfovibrionales bacterium]|nr:hypothetical protein [Thermodesulfovibrionales bacterium]MCL0046887.1 hypothetical protein [Thermodesulfovibrionales bacterium]